MTGIKLKRAGHNVTVLEQSPDDERTGTAAGITLREHAMQFMDDYDRLKHDPMAIPSPVYKLTDMATLKHKRDILMLTRTTTWEALYHRLRANFDALKSNYCSEPPTPADATLRDLV